MNPVNSPAAAEARMLRSDQVAERLGIGKRTLWRLVAAGQIPQPIRFNRKLVRWRRSEIDAFLADEDKRIAEGAPPPGRLVSPKKLASRLQVSVGTIYRLIDQGHLTAYRRAGGHILLRQCDVDSLLVLVEPKATAEAQS